MDDERKDLLVAGIYLGDITLALASVAHELPAYVRGLDLSGVMPDKGETAAIAGEVDKMLAGEPDPENLPEPVIRTVLERGIERGKFFSAIRCLEMLDERDKCVGGYISSALKSIEAGDAATAARDFAIAANLDLDDAAPMFQYSGALLHEGCTSSPDECVTRLSGEAAVHRGLKYLLGSEKVSEAVEGLSAEARRTLLPLVALERDPDALEFYRGLREAHRQLEELERGEIHDLEEDVRRIQRGIEGFSESLGRTSPASDEGRQTLERLKRTAGSLGKEFAGVEDLVKMWQFRRLRDRLEHLLESGEEIEDGGKALARDGSTEQGPVEPVMGLIADLGRKDILKSIDDIEERLASTQITMLGRQVHSQEHWQFLREIAFKYPVSPLMVCLRRVDDRWMVVPRWESEIVGLLRDRFETLTPATGPEVPSEEE
jgi:hypothetical protein